MHTKSEFVVDRGCNERLTAIAFRSAQSADVYSLQVFEGALSTDPDSANKSCYTYSIG